MCGVPLKPWADVVAGWEVAINSDLDARYEHSVCGHAGNGRVVSDQFLTPTAIGLRARERAADPQIKHHAIEPTAAKKIMGHSVVRRVVVDRRAVHPRAMECPRAPAASGLRESVAHGGPHSVPARAVEGVDVLGFICHPQGSCADVREVEKARVPIEGVLGVIVVRHNPQTAPHEELRPLVQHSDVDVKVLPRTGFVDTTYACGSPLG